MAPQGKLLICGNQDGNGIWKGLLCKECFDKKEEGHGKKKNYCSLCGAKMGLIRYNPKGKWKIEGQFAENVGMKKRQN